MIEIEQIKMRKDIRILHEKYKFTFNALARGLGVSNCMIRRLISKENIFLNKESHITVKDNLLNIQQELKEAKEYQGFDN